MISYNLTYVDDGYYGHWDAGQVSYDIEENKQTNKQKTTLIKLTACITIYQKVLARCYKIKYIAANGVTEAIHKRRARYIKKRFLQKYVHLCSEDERKSYEVGTTWSWKNNVRIFILVWTTPLNVDSWCGAKIFKEMTSLSYRIHQAHTLICAASELNSLKSLF